MNYKNEYLPFRRNDERYDDVKMCLFIDLCLYDFQQT